MNIGNSIRVKKGVQSLDDNELTIEGWEGRVIEINDDIITIELDSITLSKLKDEYITDSIVNGQEYTLLCLEIDEVEIVIPRDSETDTINKQLELASEYSFDEQENRLSAIVGTDNDSVNMNNLQKYFNYLKENLNKSCILTGMEDFDWEEPYLFGGWSKKEYEKLKITKPSYTDTFEFIGLVEEYDDWKGIYAFVKRVSDKKLFNIPLWDLKVIDKKDSNFLLISDYSSWMTNYR